MIQKQGQNDYEEEKSTQPGLPSQSMETSQEIISTRDVIKFQSTSRQFYEVTQQQGQTSTLLQENANTKSKQLENNLILYMKYDFLTSTEICRKKLGGYEQFKKAKGVVEIGASQQQQAVCCLTNKKKTGDLSSLAASKKHLSLNYELEMINGGDVMISLVDLQVWLLNKKCEKEKEVEMELFEEIWEKIGQEHLQKKSLNLYLKTFAQFLVQHHRHFKKEQANIKQFILLLTSTRQLNQAHKIKPLSNHKKEKSIFSKRKFSFMVKNLELLGPNQDRVFSGESLGFYAKIYFQGKKILVTQLKQVEETYVKWKESFTLDVFLLCGWLDVKIYQVFAPQKSDDQIGQRKVGEAKIDLFGTFLSRLLQAPKQVKKIQSTIIVDTVKNAQMDLEQIAKKGIKRHLTTGTRIPPPSLIPRHPSAEKPMLHSDTSSDSERAQFSFDLACCLEGDEEIERKRSKLAQQRERALDKYIKMKTEECQSTLDLLQSYAAPFQEVIVDENEITISPVRPPKESSFKHSATEGCPELKCNNQKCLVF